MPFETRQSAPWFRKVTRVFVGASPADNGLSVWREVAVALATGTFMALICALGTQEAPLQVRLAFWIGLMSAGTIIGHGVTVLAGRLELFEQRPWLWAVLTARGPYAQPGGFSPQSPQRPYRQSGYAVPFRGP